MVTDLVTGIKLVIYRTMTGYIIRCLLLLWVPANYVYLLLKIVKLYHVDLSILLLVNYTFTYFVIQLRLKNNLFFYTNFSINMYETPL